MTADLFRPAPELNLSVEGSSDARRHFRAEYGTALVRPTSAPVTPHVRVSFGDIEDGSLKRARGAHKTVRWSVALGDANNEPLSVRIDVAGRPRRFALSLVQGFIVEPLVSVAAARAGIVLLPAGALVADGGALILLGRSGAGKTSIVARALAAGQAALGDDQVMLTGRGALRPWPRRLRVYPDLRATAPAAVRRLRPRERAALAGLGALRATTRGWIAPSMPLTWQQLGAEPALGPLPARRVIVLERGDEADDVAVEPLSERAVVALACEILGEQRERFGALAGARWSEALVDTDRCEHALLAAALAGVPAERWSVPPRWPAAAAVSALASRLGVEG